MSSLLRITLQEFDPATGQQRIFTLGEVAVGAFSPEVGPRLKHKRLRALATAVAAWNTVYERPAESTAFRMAAHAALHDAFQRFQNPPREDDLPPTP